MLAQTLSALTEAVLKAQLLAVQKLAALLETAEDPRELRRIATALLRLKPPTLESITAAEPQAAAPLHHAAPKPLLPAELADLNRLFPNKRPGHFTQTHSPDHWRCILNRRPTIPTPPSSAIAHALPASP